MKFESFLESAFCYYTLRRLKKILNAKNKIFFANFRTVLLWIVLTCSELHNATSTPKGTTRADSRSDETEMSHVATSYIKIWSGMTDRQGAKKKFGPKQKVYFSQPVLKRGTGTCRNGIKFINGMEKSPLNAERNRNRNINYKNISERSEKIHINGTEHKRLLKK